MTDNETIQAITKAIPAPQLLTETDNPGGYHWLAGELGRPSIVRSVVKMISDIRGWDQRETEHLVVENFIKLAGKDSWVPQLIKQAANKWRSANKQHVN